MGWGRKQDRNFLRELPQRREIIEDPEAAAVSADDQVAIVHYQIADRCSQHVQPQRLPVLAVIEADEDSEFRSGEQQAFAHRILAYRVHRAIREPAHDLLPGSSAIVSAPDVRLEVVQAKSIDGG